MSGEWSKEEINILKNNYLSTTSQNIEKLLSPRRYGAIRKKANSLGLKKTNSLYFTDYEVDFIRQNYKTMTFEEIGKELNRSAYSVQVKAGKLKLVKSAKWTDEELSILKSVYPLYTNSYIVENYLPNRNIHSIGDMARKLGLSNLKSYNVKEFTKEILIKYLQNYAELIGRTPLSVELIGNEDMPSLSTYTRYFGTYENACKECGLTSNICLFGDYTTISVAKDGNYCYSNAELIITNFLIDNNISFIKEELYTKILKKDCGFKRCDWYLDNYNIIVEYFGLLGKDYYLKKANEKRLICKKNNIKLIEISDRYLNKNKLLKIFNEYIQSKSVTTTL